MLLILASFLIATNSGFSAVQHSSFDAGNYTPQSTAYASISIYLYEGESCACKPVRNEYIFAEGITTDHYTSNYTDEDGLCVLEIEFDETYQIIIDIDPFQKIIFDVDIVDDQIFSFYLQPKEDSVYQQMGVRSLSQSNP
jgi:hypothetical protein